ncbi:MAG: site-specific DNA-methyltransferase, partial [Planctomycetaceae bacterium]|nr:site-specific DNA-methyltransferase [Planctomycetaceae bacterium]
QEGSHSTGKMRAKDRPLANDNLSDEEFDKLLNAWFGNIARVLEPGRAAYIWGGYRNYANYPAALKANGFHFAQAIIWNKMHPVMNRKDFMSCYELCFYCWKEGAAHKFFGQNNERDLWEVKKEPSQKTVHPTQKPVELAVRAIQLSSMPGENVLELFGGSGSTLIACEQTGRNCFAMEIDEAFCDVIVQRWQEFTGKVAKKAS